MDSCLLCLEINKDLLDSIERNSKQWQSLHITTVLEKHFWSLNTIQASSWICLSCWQKVYDFHNFYLRIEEAHITFGNIKVEKGHELITNQKELIIKNEIKEKFTYYFEQEIVLDPNKCPGLSDEKSSFELFETTQNFNENNILKKDPLQKTKMYSKVKKIKNTKLNTLNETHLVGNNEEVLQVKSEAEVSSDNNDYLDSPTDDDRDIVARNQQTNTRKQDDKFIVEHFKQIACDICAQPLENFSALKKHFIKMHKQKGYISCCNRKFYQRNHFVDHLHCHLNPDYFKCTQCGKILSDRKNFKSHMLRVHRPNDVILKHRCEICGKSFTQGYVLRTHKLTHLPKEEKKFPCTECGKFYSSSNLLKLHTEVVHLKKHAKICYICGKTLGTSTEYKAHMSKHEGIPAPVINCDVCGLRLISERSLKLHKESQHPLGGKKDHPCPVCQKISPTARALKKHINTMHEKGCDHKCNMCEKAFRRAETLKEHMASHMGTKLYKCPWCPKTFNSNGNMHDHRKNFHPKESLELKLQRYSKKL